MGIGMGKLGVVGGEEEAGGSLGEFDSGLCRTVRKRWNVYGLQ